MHISFVDCAKPELIDCGLARRSTGKTVKYSAFCLSLMSPFFHKTICGPFKEGTERQMVLGEDESAVRKVMELACGCKGGVRVRDVQEMMQLGAVADQYGMEAVVSAVEEAIVRSVAKGKQGSDVQEMMRLGEAADRIGMKAVVSAVEEAIVRSMTMETCGEVLCSSGGGQLPRAVLAARMYALARFEAMSRSGGFKAMSEEVLCDLGGDDALAAAEEALSLRQVQQLPLLRLLQQVALQGLLQQVALQ